MSNATVDVIKMSAREEAVAVLEAFAGAQESVPYNADLLPCPRCGNYNMMAILTHNASSRNYEGAVCNTCGQEEAMEDAGMLGRMQPEEWALTKAYAKAHPEEGAESSGHAVVARYVVDIRPISEGEAAE